MQASAYSSIAPLAKPVISTSSKTLENPPVEDMLNHILKKLPDLKISQEEAHIRTNEQLAQINASMLHLSSHLFQAEQRVSDLEDAKSKRETGTSQIQVELEEIQLKRDKAENRSRRPNLTFVRIPEDYEATSTVTKVISDLIYRHILPDRATASAGLTIIRVLNSRLALVAESSRTEREFETRHRDSWRTVEVVAATAQRPRFINK
ncbi:hypothetical protein NDU88_006094 [Pleurodeles waltl]|uniref:Uncharacterized protein n=1 Tax=Pleurodeles waltl TaxID=8319 RepID=A0AAV7VL13_PLEWA|nr:hypothetical protein NDU88_006094 [Pleurodeles waltl]